MLQATETHKVFTCKINNLHNSIIKRSIIQQSKDQRDWILMITYVYIKCNIF